jgi:shikimate dehydrogenase
MRTDGTDGVYLPLPVMPTQAAFDSFMDATADAALGIFGLSVTIPHKEHAFNWLQSSDGHVSMLAKRCKAVNTLTRDASGAWHGANTDIEGIQLALRSPLAAIPTSLHEALVLGAGGVARAAVIALQGLGLRVTIANRTRDRADALAAEFGVATIAWENRTDAAADVLINCTSVGMQPADRASDVSPFPADAIRPGMIVLDTVYTPPCTRLIREAAERGAVAITGETMFLEQAARQFQLWHGRRPPA